MIDLTAKEQMNVRAALAFLRLRCGGWGPVGKMIKFKDTTLSAISKGHKTVSPVLVFRIARLAKVPIDDILNGRFPEPGTCPHCGHRTEPSS